jgi:hypothetical protein
MDAYSAFLRREVFLRIFSISFNIWSDARRLGKQMNPAEEFLEQTVRENV